MEPHHSLLLSIIAANIQRMNLIQLALFEVAIKFILWKQAHVKRVRWLTSAQRQYPLRQKVMIRFMRYKLHVWISVEALPSMQQMDTQT